MSTIDLEADNVTFLEVSKSDARDWLDGNGVDFNEELETAIDGAQGDCTEETPCYVVIKVA